ncbi:hypothetical protein G6O67_004713 [Ophiocordyceps sinensis]|uniref:Uncharacterized protein n=1 Tax=Ophiocordyceps sinensis TaxID=72228 RepID=A0A8H4PPZ8_9HYPO|nr:hypothetical protein G6O67_004713 [Ophiocordyceps sinensis]
MIPATKVDQRLPPTFRNFAYGSPTACWPGTTVENRNPQVAYPESASTDPAGAVAGSSSQVRDAASSLSDARRAGRKGQSSQVAGVKRHLSASVREPGVRFVAADRTGKLVGLGFHLDFIWSTRLNVLVAHPDVILGKRLIFRNARLSVIRSKSFVVLGLPLYRRVNVKCKRGVVRYLLGRHVLGVEGLSRGVACVMDGCMVCRVVCCFVHVASRIVVRRALRGRDLGILLELGRPGMVVQVVIGLKVDILHPVLVVGGKRRLLTKVDILHPVLVGGGKGRLLTVHDGSLPMNGYRASNNAISDGDREQRKK